MIQVVVGRFFTTMTKGMYPGAMSPSEISFERLDQILDDLVSLVRTINADTKTTIECLVEATLDFDSPSLDQRHVDVARVLAVAIIRIAIHRQDSDSQRLLARLAATGAELGKTTLRAEAAEAEIARLNMIIQTAVLEDPPTLPAITLESVRRSFGTPLSRRRTPRVLWRGGGR